ncbi:MAG: YlxR family protein [Chloroflexota bacterium]
MACRTSRAKQDLVRVVRTPSGEVQLDPTGRLAGRGAYVCPDEPCLTNAIRRGAIGRALQHAVPDGVRAILASTAAAHQPEGDAHGQE